MKIQEILNQQRCIEALIEETLLSLDLTKVEKVEMVGKVKCAIILCLIDKLLMEVAREKHHMRWVYMVNLLSHIVYETTTLFLPYGINLSWKS